MPFDYMHVQIPEEFRNAPEKAKAMYRQELKERAAMLRRLGYDEAEVLMRLTTNVRWDWEANEAPSIIEELKGELPAIVKEVYSR